MCVGHRDRERVDALAQGKDSDRTSVNDDTDDDQEARNRPDELNDVEMFESWFRKLGQRSRGVGF